MVLGGYMNITLNQNEYNHLFQALSVINGKASIVANKLITQIRGLVDDGKAKEIDLAVENYELETILKGIVELAIAPKSTAQDIDFLKYIASLLKIKGAFTKHLDELIDKTATVDVDSSIETD